MKLFLGSIAQEFAYLNKEESHHFTKVLRGKMDDIVYVTDGKGDLIKGSVSELNPKSVKVIIVEKWSDFEKKNYHLHLGIAPTKNLDRLEFFLEKATEIGIDEISFLHSFNSERKNINLERLERIVLAAVKQSLKAYVPKLNELIKFNEFITQNHTQDKFIAHCFEDLNRESYKSAFKKGGDLLILIGPEGDFSKEEVQQAESKGFKSISLGHQRFRTETAALQTVFAVDYIQDKLIS